MRRVLWTILAVVLTTGAGIRSSSAQAKSETIVPVHLPAILQPAVSKLQHAPIPVYLPTWLPPVHGAHLFLDVQASGSSYEVTVLSDGPNGAFGNGHHCNQCAPVWIAGDTRPSVVKAWTRPAQLSPSTWAYITAPAPTGYWGGTCCHTTIDWARFTGDGMTWTEQHYSIGGSGGWTDQQLLRMARSAIRVH